MTDTPVTPVFVSRQTAAALMMVGVDKFDEWVRSGFVPAPCINRGQIIRWHWPTIETRLASLALQHVHDPSIVDVDAFRRRENLKKEERLRAKAAAEELKAERARERAQKALQRSKPKSSEPGRTE